MNRIRIFCSTEPDTLQDLVNMWIEKNEKQFEYIESIQMESQNHVGDKSRLVMMVYYVMEEGKTLVVE